MRSPLPTTTSTSGATTSIRLIVVLVALSAGVFVLDLSLPLGVAGGVLYVAVVLVSLWSSHRRVILASATLGTVLTILGHFLSPTGGVPRIVLTNRGFAVFAIWVAALLSLQRKIAEEQVSESESRYARAAKIARLGHWYRDFDKGRAAWSSEMYEILGVNPNEFEPTYRAFLNLLHPSDRQKWERAAHAALSEDKPLDLECRVRRPDGEERVAREPVSPNPTITQ